MKHPALLCTLLVATLPTVVLAKSKKGSSAGAGLPPKWSGLIQPAPAIEPSMRPGLFTSDLGGKDLEFLTGAIESGRVQVWLCKTAKEKAEADQVRAVGDALEGTQTQENGYVAKLAAKKGLVLATAAVPPTQKKLTTELALLNGPKFDKALMDQIIVTAQQAVTSYETASQSGDPDIKNMAERLLPVAKDKLLLANKISGRSQEGRPAFRTGVQAIPTSAAAGSAPAPIAAGTGAAAAVKAAATPAPATPAAKPTMTQIVPPPAVAAPARPEGPKPVPENLLKR